ncbi:MAG TPA: LamG-like jellyroll fold domain-containing protein [Candidatus Limnocylindrales bacterium]
MQTRRLFSLCAATVIVLSGAASTSSRAGEPAPPGKARAEVLSARSETRQVFAEPDGSYTMELSSKPVRAFQNHQWVPVDTALKRKPGGIVVPEAAAAELEISGGGQGMLVRQTLGANSFALSWPGHLPEPSLDGDTATYANVFQDVDLRVRATAQGFSHLLVVKTPEAAKVLPDIHFELSTNLKPSINSHGGLTLTDAKGALVLESTRADMWDSGALRAVGRLEVTPRRLTLIPDRALLSNPDAKFPIVIDPDYFPPGAGWTKVFEGNPNTGYWNGGVDDGLAKVGYCGWPGCNGIGTTRSFFQFDITALRGAHIMGAEFNMHESHAPSCSPRVFEVHQTGPIGGGTTWNNQPGFWGWLGNHNVALGYNSNCPANWVGVDAGQAVRNRLAEGSNVATFGMKSYTNWIRQDCCDDWQIKDAHGWKKFDTAHLIVHYDWPPYATGMWANAGNGPSLGCPGDRDVSFTPTGEATLHATLSDPDGHNVAAEFEWWVWGGSKVGSQTTTAQPNGTVHAVTIPRGAFGDGAAISWRVRGHDGIVWGGFTGWCQITVDARPPGRPGVTSTDYPEDGTAGYLGKTGAFTVTTTEPDVIGFQWSLNFADFPVVDVNSNQFVRATDGRGTVRATPSRDGRNDLYVRAVDRALNPSPHYQKFEGGEYVPGGYGFNVGSEVPPPAGHWPLDGDGVSSVPDVSGHGHHGTLTGTTGWTTGRVGDAVNFNGSDGQVTTSGGPALDTSGTFTVAAWARLDRTGGWPAIVSQDGRNSAGFQLQGSYDGRWSFVMFSEDIAGGGQRHSRVFSPGLAQVGVWTHVAGVHDSGLDELRLYVDGVRVGSIAHPNAWAAAGPLTIGRSMWAGQPVDFFPGGIDDVRAYNRMLTDDEIRALAGRPVNEEVFFPLDEGTGTRTADVSGNYRTGTLFGDPTWKPGPVGTHAVEFDGQDDAIVAAGQAVRTDKSFTVTARAWLKSKNGVHQTVVSQDGPQSSGFVLQYRPTPGTNGKWSFSVSQQDASNPAWLTVDAAAEPDTQQWVHLAGVYDAQLGEVRLYVNGTMHRAPARVAAHVPGNLVIGRARQGSTPVTFFDGRVDDVHAYTGVLTKEEIDADNFNPVTARPTVYTGQISSYIDHAGKHFVTNGPVPPGFGYRGSLGMLAPPGTPGTQMLYSCRYSGGQFVSLQSTCEGYTLLGEIGLVYVSPPEDVPVLAIYRCVVDATGDHFISHQESCHGHRNEGPYGYAPAYRHLIRYVKEFAPADHETTVVGPRQGYRAEGVQGIVAMTGDTGAIGLWACFDGTDEFVSTASNCDGKQVRWWIGGIWTTPPAHAAVSVPMYQCLAPGDRFTSFDEFCEGHTVLGTLGYVITRF